MFSRLIPDCIFPDYRSVTVGFLREQGISALLLDIDNTLAPYEDAEPNDELRTWLRTLAEDGVRIAFVSNNRPSRVERFNRTLGYPAYPRARKPLRKIPARALAELGSTKAQTAVMGDQIFTDVLTGRRLGTRTILVPPIRDKRDLFTRFKRLCERPILRAYIKRELKNKEI